MKLTRKLIAINLALLLSFSLMPLQALAASIDLSNSPPVSFTEPNADGYTYTPTSTGFYTVTFSGTEQESGSSVTPVTGASLNVYQGENTYVAGFEHDGLKRSVYSYTIPMKADTTYTIIPHGGELDYTSKNYNLSVVKADIPALTVGAPAQFSVVNGASSDLDDYYWYAPHYFSFTPSQSGWYTFDLSSSSQVVYAGDICAYSNTFSPIEWNPAYIGEGINEYLQGGQTYYLGFEPAESSAVAGTYSITVSPSSFPAVTTTTSQNVVTDGMTAYATFTPETSGSYLISATSTDNWLYRMDVYSRAMDWLGGAQRQGNSPVLSVTVNMTGETTYYIGVDGSSTISAELAGLNHSYCGKITDQYPNGENLTWELSSDGTLIISGTGEMRDYDFRESPWYESRDKIKTAEIGDGTTSVGCFAFSECTGLTKVTIPDSVSTIAVGAFQVCTGLTSITIPDGVTYIEDAAFSSCTGLTSVEIPSSVASIGQWAFTSCSALADVYYSGTKVQWDAILIKTDNDPLLNANIHFLGEDEYTYEITSPLGTMDEEIGHYVVDPRYSEVMVDAPVEEIANVYIDDVILAQDSETSEDYYTTNTLTDGATSIAVYAPNSGSIGSHTLTIEFNPNGNSPVPHRTQNFVTLPADSIILPTGYVGMGYDYGFDAGWGDYELYDPDEVFCLPDGLTIDGMLLTGIPTKAGTWYFLVEANSAGVSKGTESYKITIKESPEEELPSGVKYVPYSYQVNCSIPVIGYEVTKGRLPNGMELNPETGEIYGAPTETGTFVFDVLGKNGNDDPDGGHNISIEFRTRHYRLTIQSNTNSAVQRPNDYDIIENVGTQDPYDPNSFYKEDYSEETFAINGPYEEFYRLLIDGREKIRDVDYTVREGSTIITVRAQTFRDVGEGTHTIAAEFRGKDSSGKDTMRQAAQNYTLTIRRPSENTGSGSSSGDSGGSSSPTYSIKVPKIPNCTIKVTPTGASAGTRITLTVRPDTGYVLSNLAVTGPKDSKVALTQKDDFKYTFRMPDGKVSISAQVEREQPEPTPAGETPFTDMKETDWFYHDVAEVYAKGWMVGTSKDTFSPREQISRGMIVTILHRIAGEPAAENTYFADVPLNRYYTAAAAWAVEQGIVTGYGDGHFGPSDPMTREQIIMILYNYANLNKLDTSKQSDLSQFNDVAQLSPDARQAMSWAYSIGLIKGKGDGILDPAGATTRAETAAFLTRFVTLTED